MLGNSRCEAQCIDNIKRLCHIRGKMHKKVWIAAGDIILVGLRDYQFSEVKLSAASLQRDINVAESRSGGKAAYSVHPSGLIVDSVLTRSLYVDYDVTDSTLMLHGALRCLALLSADIHDKAVPSVVSILFPSLLSIVSSPQIYDKSLRAKALSIVHNCTSMLGVMSGVYKAEASHLMSPMLQQWMMQFSAILSLPVEYEDPDDWSMRMEVLKCLSQFVQHFSAATAKDFMVIVGPLWQTFITSLRIYEQAMIEGALDSFEGTFDSDGEEKSLESFAIQSAPHARKTECGYYVMRYMIEIITRFDLKRTVNEHFNDMMPYSQEDIDEVRGLWADYFLNN